MYLLLLIAAFIAGMYVENKFSFRLKIKDNHFGFQYKNNAGQVVFKALFR